LKLLKWYRAAAAAGRYSGKINIVDKIVVVAAYAFQKSVIN